jgi:hypothetical protein
MSECPEQWKLDVNQRYQAAVGVVSSLATASLVLPIFFLKDVVSTGSGKSIADSLSCLVFAGWLLLALSILSAVFYHYCSAKWVKLAWGKKADMLGREVNSDQVEKALDISYFLMMVGFASGAICMVIFMTTFILPAKSAQQSAPAAPPASAPLRPKGS